MNKQDLDLIADYAKKFVDAVTPAAKQAYETGLLTLRIDAAGDLVVAFVLLMLTFIFAYVGYLISKKYEWHPDVIGASITVNVVVGVPLWVFFIWHLFSVWTWTKLVAPEMWLVHQAIEKIMK